MTEKPVEKKEEEKHVKAEEKKEAKVEKKEAPKDEAPAAPKEAPKTEAPAAVPATPAVAPAVAPAPVRRRHRVAIVHVYSSKNDTIITATDQSGAETLAWASGGMMVKSDREEGRPYAAMQAASKVITDLKEKGVTLVHIRIRAPGGTGSKTPGSGAQAVVRTVARTGVRVGRIDDVTPLPTDSMKRKGGRRGRRV